jgi:hypothetical protein
MPLTITPDAITGDRTRHTARPAPGHRGAWEVSWLPGRLVDRTSAITAMALAEVAGSGPVQPGDRLWPHIESWATVIGLTAPDALARISQPSAGISAERHDPEPGS